MVDLGTVAMFCRVRISEGVIVSKFLAPNSEKGTQASLLGASELTQILVAFASRENATVAEILDLANELSLSTFGQGIGQSAEKMAAYAVPVETTGLAETTIVPAVKIEEAVTDDKVFCLCCGKGFSMLKRHLKAEHGLTEQQYRERFGLSDDFPLVAPNYSNRKAAYAKQVGLGKYQRQPLKEPQQRAAR
jgi:predicted transcriptional regulator